MRDRIGPKGEWLKSRPYKINDMAGVGRETTFVELAAVSGVNKERDGAA